MKPLPDLTEEEIFEETERLLRVLSWNLTKEGLDRHVFKNTSVKSTITRSFIMHLLEDAADQDRDPVKILKSVVMGMWGQADDHQRTRIEKAFMSNGLTAFMDTKVD